MTAPSTIRILIAEDNLGDFALLVEAFAEIGFAAECIRAKDGVMALSLLERFMPAERPALILLDINLPKMNGHEVLARVRAMDLSQIPVVMLTSSTSATDREKSASANGFFTKWSSWAQCLQVATALREMIEARR